MGARKIRDAADARQCLALAEAAGVERRHWAREHGVDGRSLAGWARKLGPGAGGDRASAARGGEARVGMVELVARSRPAASPVLVRCGRFTVEVPAQTDEAALCRVLRAIAAC